MTDTLEVINELCVSVDAELREQKREALRRYSFALDVGWAQQLKMCPDWPPARLHEYAKRRARWYAADVAEDGLEDAITVGDAVWLLLQQGALRREQLEPFAVACAQFACIGARHITAATTAAQWASMSKLLHSSAVAADKLRVPGAPDTDARQLQRASRAAGLVAVLLERSSNDAFDSAAVARRIALLSALNWPDGPQPEVLRQLKHLHALVT